MRKFFLLSVIFASAAVTILSCANAAGGGGSGSSGFSDTNAAANFKVKDDGFFIGKKFYCLSQSDSSRSAAFEASGNLYLRMAADGKLYVASFDDHNNRFVEDTEADSSYSVDINSRTITFENIRVPVGNSVPPQFRHFGGTASFSEDGTTLTGELDGSDYVWGLTADPAITRETDSDLGINGATTIWSGSKDFAYWTSGDEKRWIRVPKKGFSEGDKIIVTFEQSPSFDGYKTIMLAGCFGEEWTETYLQGGGTDNAYIVGGRNEFNLVPYRDAQKIIYTLAPDDAKRLNDHNGLAVYGCGVKVTKVEAKTYRALQTSVQSVDSTNGAVLFEGENDFGNWGEHLGENKDDIWIRLRYKGFSAGDQIQITHQASDICTYDASDIIIQMNARDGNWSSTRLKGGTLANAYTLNGNGENIIPFSANQTTAYVLTASDAKRLNDGNGLVVLAGGIKVTKIVAKTASPLVTDSGKNGWDEYSTSYDKDFFNGSLSFNKSFRNRSARHLEGLELAVAHDVYKEFKFVYTVNSSANTITISNVYEVVTTQQDEQNFRADQNEIAGIGAFTAEYVLDRGDGKPGLKFNSIPSGVLSEYFTPNVYYKWTDNPEQLDRVIRISTQKNNLTTGEDVVINVSFTNFRNIPSNVELIVDNGGSGATISNGKITLSTRGLSLGSHSICVYADNIFSNTISISLSEPQVVSPVFHWNSSAKAFEGSVTWTATSVEDKVLLGLTTEGFNEENFVEKVEWKAMSPKGDSIYAWSKSGNYSISRDYVLTASVLVDDFGQFADCGALHWADVPGVALTVTIHFKTGRKVELARLNGYGGCDEDYPTRISDYLTTGKTMNANYALLPWVDGGKVKIKSAVAYKRSGGPCSTEEMDWTNSSFMGNYETGFYNADDFKLTFSPEILQNVYNDQITRLVITTLSGRIIDLSE